MKKILKIYIGDIKNIVTNYAALITIIALCILPSLYAWFNIAASWDPYSKEATSQIRIGVVNEDAGSELRGEEINLGDKIIDSLKENDLMGWMFLNGEDAEKLLENGEIYASITIPSEFSKDITSVITSDIKKGDIIYRVNEKINAIAPKLTVKGASGVQENISKTLVETVSDSLLTVTKDIGIELEEAKPKISNVYNALREIQLKFDDLNQTVDLASDGIIKIRDLSESIQKDIPTIQKTLTNSKNLSSDVKEFLYSSKNSLNKLSPTIKEDIRLLGEISKDISNKSEILINAIETGSEYAPELVDNILNKAESMDKLSSSIIKILEALNKFSPKLNDVIESMNNVKSGISSLKATLETIKDSINKGEKPDTSLMTNLKTFSDDINSISSDLYSKYDTEILGKINNIFDEAYNVTENVIEVLNEAENKLPSVNSLLTTAYEGADKGSEVIDFAKEKLPLAENIVNTLVSKMDEVNNDKEFEDLLNLLKNDINTRSDFLANPVNLVEEKLFPMQNYGTAMTPFYTTLSLWTGVLFLVSLLSVNPHHLENDNVIIEENHQNVTKRSSSYTVIQGYFGKLLLFITISIIQAIIVSLGDLYILDIYCLNKSSFILTSILTSILFAVVVFTACSVLGNAGKVICIVLLVFQIGGSGGTFPIELTPKFFQSIHPFLPFTYTISLMRETIGGIVYDIVKEDLIVISSIIISSIIIGIFLKKPFNKIISKFTEKFEESNLGE